MATESEAAANADNEKRRQVREEERKKHEADVKKLREDNVKLANEKAAADAKLRPTPTPDELAMAARGHNADQKEPDGSPEQDVHHPITREPDGSPEQDVHHPITPAGSQIEVGRKTVEAQPQQSGYATRTAVPKKD